MLRCDAKEKSIENCGICLDARRSGWYSLKAILLKNINTNVNMPYLSVTEFELKIMVRILRQVVDAPSLDFTDFARVAPIPLSYNEENALNQFLDRVDYVDTPQNLK